MSVQAFGMAAFRRAISNGLELAARAEEHIRNSAVLETLSPTSPGIVCCRVHPADAQVSEEALEEVNRNVLARAFWEEPALMSSTMLKGTFALRLCILHHATTMGRRPRDPGGHRAVRPRGPGWSG